MRRSAILLVVAAMAMAIALPAEAKKPPPKDPPAEPTYYTVDMSVETGADGVTTSCGAEDVVVRRDGIHFEWYYDIEDEDLPDDIQLHLVATGLTWLGLPISGCRGAGEVEVYDIDGALLDPSLLDPPLPPPVPGYFRVTLEDDGTVAMLWIFDIYERYDQVRQNKKRIITELTERTDFRMGGPYLDEGGFASAIGWDSEQGWEANDGSINFTVDGSFSFVHYVRGGDPLFTDLTNGSQMFTLDITLTPR